MQSKRKITHLVVFGIATSTFLLIGCQNDNNSKQVDDGVVTIGIYSGNGAAEGCVIASERMFQWMGFTTRRLISNDFNNRQVSDIDVFYFPGGSSGPYISEITNDGKVYLKDLIFCGCGFIGTCAGSLLACESQLWEGNHITDGHLGIFGGKGIGPNPEIYDYPEIGMCRIDLNTNHPITSYFPDSVWIMFYNSPYFELNTNSSASIIGTYTQTGKPAIVACSYGHGRVFLTAPHPEFEEDSDRDGVPYFKEFDDLGSDWELMKSATEWCLKIY